jgi:hypothetical protein
MGAASARHSLRPLLSRGEWILQTSDASRREIAEVYVKFERRHCEERKRRSNPFFLCAARWIASLTLAMTVSDLAV